MGDLLNAISGLENGKLYSSEFLREGLGWLGVELIDARG